MAILRTEQKMKRRREFLRTCLLGGAVLGVRPRLLWSGASSRVNAAAWERMPEILARIKPPNFPDRDFEVTQFGAAANGHADCTGAFQKAIEACTAAGGGRVIVPPGEFLTGAIHLKSNVNLHIAFGATVRFTHDLSKYPLTFTRFEGVELMNFSPFIYAFEQNNIAVTGQGTIDGNAGCAHWWPWAGLPSLPWKHGTSCGWKGSPHQANDRKRLFEMAEKGTSVKDRIFGEGHYLRPQFIQPYRCQNVLIEGVTLKNSPMWQVHPVLCRNVTVRGLTITSLGPNNDGCDPESCTDVLIKDCVFDTGDDCIAIKSGRNADGRRLSAPSQNIVIQDCTMKAGHGGVTIGSEISGGVRDVFVEDCRMGGPHLDIAVRIKNNAMRGGLIENIYARKIEISEVAVAGLSIDFFYEEGKHGRFKAVVRDVDIRNIVVQKAKYALYLRGFQSDPIDDIHLTDCNFKAVEKRNVIENVRGLELRDVRINGKLEEGAQ